MTLSYIPSSRKLAGWSACLAFALVLSTGIDARGALKVPTGTSSPQMPTRWMASSMIVDWNSECKLQNTVGPEVQECMELPFLTPEDEEANDVSSAADDEVTSNNENAYNPDSRVSEENAQLETENELAAQEDMSSDSQSDGDMTAENQFDQASDQESDNVSTRSAFEKYYGYRYESLEDRIGDNASDDTQEEQDVNSAPGKVAQSSDDGQQSTGDCQSNDSATTEKASSAGTPLTDAVLALASEWTEQFASDYGVNLPRFARVVFRNW